MSAPSEPEVLLVQRRIRGPLSLVVALVVGVSTLVIAPAPAGAELATAV